MTWYNGGNLKVQAWSDEGWNAAIYQPFAQRGLVRNQACHSGSALAPARRMGYNGERCWLLGWRLSSCTLPGDRHLDLTNEEEDFPYMERKALEVDPFEAQKNEIKCGGKGVGLVFGWRGISGDRFGAAKNWWHLRDDSGRSTQSA
jgi:hypothetical protein